MIRVCCCNVVFSGKVVKVFSSGFFLERVCVGVVSVLSLTATCEINLPPQAYVRLSVVCDRYVPKLYSVDGVSIPDLSLTARRANEGVSLQTSFDNTLLMSGEVFSSLLFLLPWRECLEERKIIVVLTESLTLNRSESRRDHSGFSTADVKLFFKSSFCTLSSATRSVPARLFRRMALPSCSTIVMHDEKWKHGTYAPRHFSMTSYKCTSDATLDLDLKILIFSFSSSSSSSIKRPASFC